MRIRDGSDPIPKPLVTIGPRPIIWHLMKYYAHFGHKDFILCLGHRGDMIKSYFRNYDECLSNDFVLSGGGRDIQLFNSDIQDWRITFVDTGPTASVGQRLRKNRVRLFQEHDGFAKTLFRTCDSQYFLSPLRGRKSKFDLAVPHHIEAVGAVSLVE